MIRCVGIVLAKLLLTFPACAQSFEIRDYKLIVHTADGEREIGPAVHAATAPDGRHLAYLHSDVLHWRRETKLLFDPTLEGLHILDLSDLSDRIVHRDLGTCSYVSWSPGGQLVMVGCGTGPVSGLVIVDWRQAKQVNVISTAGGYRWLSDNFLLYAPEAEMRTNFGIGPVADHQNSSLVLLEIGGGVREISCGSEFDDYHIGSEAIVHKHYTPEHYTKYGPYFYAVLSWVTHLSMSEEYQLVPMSEQPEIWGEVTENGLRLRSEPSLSAAVLGSLNKGQKVQVHRRSAEQTLVPGGIGRWFLVEHASLGRGWTPWNYPYLYPEPNMIQAPIGSFNYFDNLTILKETDENHHTPLYNYWYEITFGSRKGWVFGHFLTLTASYADMTGNPSPR